MTATSHQQSDHPIARRLESKGIRKVIVIDDAYDEPSRDEFIAGEMHEFWTRIELMKLLARN